jgi:hypothetical protein
MGVRGCGVALKQGGGDTHQFCGLAGAGKRWMWRSLSLAAHWSDSNGGGQHLWEGEKKKEMASWSL